MWWGEQLYYVLMFLDPLPPHPGGERVSYIKLYILHNAGRGRGRCH